MNLAKSTSPLHIALFVSGGGSTMESIIRACKTGLIPHTMPVLVVASNSNIGALEKAKRLGLADSDMLTINPKSFETSMAFGEAILMECKRRNVQFIGQYGWLAKTPSNVCDAFSGMIVNQHPGPLDTGRPDFGGRGMYGMRVHHARVEYVRRTGRNFWTEATAHRVTSQYDEGKVVKRRKVPIYSNDTAESLAMRVLPIEHCLQIELLQDVATGHVSEYVRSKPLVSIDEIALLEQCKIDAIQKFPKG